jgi:hypothetical protein
LFVGLISDHKLIEGEAKENNFEENFGLGSIHHGST